MPKVPLSNVKRSDVRLAVISTGGSVPASGYKFSDLVAAADWSRFDPAYLDGATSKAGIVHIGQFRGYPRDRWGNEPRSGSFQKQCPDGGSGSYHTYTVSADTYYSFDGQGAANTLAQNDVESNGQAYANNIPAGYCTWYSDDMTGTYSKQGCGYKGVGSTISHSIAAGAKSSTVSKADANSQAQAEMDSVGQSHVNSYGYCTWYSEALTSSVQRNNCGSGTGTWVTVSATENQFESTSSLQAANDARYPWMQAVANTNGSCTYSLPTPNLILDFFTRNSVDNYAWGAVYVNNNPNPSTIQTIYWSTTMAGPNPKTFVNNFGSYSGVYFEIYEDTVIRISVTFYDTVSGTYSDSVNITLGYYDALPA